MNGWVLSNASSRINLTVLQIQAPIRTLKVETREKLKALKIPEKPKRPLSPYLQFITEKRPALLKDNPKMKLTEVIKLLSTEWKSVSDEKKEKYKEKYQKNWEVYNQEIAKYNANLSEEQKQAMHAATTEKRKDKQKRNLTKLIKETEKPKRPVGPYLLYLKEQSLAKNMSQKDLMASLKGQWAALPEAEKKKYQDEYVKENEKYNVLLRSWEEKMIAEGHKDLVRAKTLQEIEVRPSRILNVKKSKPSDQQEFECLHSDPPATAGEDTLFHIETKPKNAKGLEKIGDNFINEQVHTSSNSFNNRTRRYKSENKADTANENKPSKQMSRNKDEKAEASQKLFSEDLSMDICNSQNVSERTEAAGKNDKNLMTKNGKQIVLDNQSKHSDKEVKENKSGLVNKFWKFFKRS